MSWATAWFRNPFKSLMKQEEENESIIVFIDYSCNNKQAASSNRICQQLTYKSKFDNFRIFNSDPLKQREQRHEERPGDDLDLDVGRGSPDGLPSHSTSDPPPSVICAEMLFRCNYVAYVAEDNRDVLGFELILSIVHI